MSLAARCNGFQKHVSINLDHLINPIVKIVFEWVAQLCCVIFPFISLSKLSCHPMDYSYCEFSAAEFNVLMFPLATNKRDDDGGKLKMEFGWVGKSCSQYVSSSAAATATAFRRPKFSSCVHNNNMMWVLFRPFFVATTPSGGWIIQMRNALWRNNGQVYPCADRNHQP